MRSGRVLPFWVWSGVMGVSVSQEWALWAEKLEWLLWKMSHWSASDQGWRGILLSALVFFNWILPMQINLRGFLGPAFVPVSPSSGGDKDPSQRSLTPRFSTQRFGFFALHLQISFWRQDTLLSSSSLFSCLVFAQLHPWQLLLFCPCNEPRRIHSALLEPKKKI